MEMVVPNLRPLKHEKECETKTVTSTPSSGKSIPNFHNRLHLGKLLHAAEICFQKHASTLDVAIVTKGGPSRLKNKFFKLSESFNSEAQGFLEIFDEVYMGGGTMCPPPPIPWMG